MNRLECCLIGAPGSGKTELAEAFQEASEDWFRENNVAPLCIVDTNDHLAGRQGRRTGVEGDHFSTFANYFNRIQTEDIIRKNGDSFISAGCIIDSIAHVNARLTILSQGIQTSEAEGIAQRELMAGQLLQTYLMDRRWIVNFAWYLPLPDKVVIPGKATSNEDTYAAQVDAIIRDVNLKMSLGIPVLAGTTEEKVKAMMTSLEDNFIGEPISDEDIEVIDEVAVSD